MATDDSPGPAGALNLVDPPKDAELYDVDDDGDDDGDDITLDHFPSERAAELWCKAQESHMILEGILKRQGSGPATWSHVSTYKATRPAALVVSELPCQWRNWKRLLCHVPRGDGSEDVAKPTEHELKLASIGWTYSHQNTYLKCPWSREMTWSLGISGVY